MGGDGGNAPAQLPRYSPALRQRRQGRARAGGDMAGAGRTGLCPAGGLEQLQLGRLRDPPGASCSPSPPLSSCSRQAWSRDNPGFEPEEEAAKAAAAAAGPVLAMEAGWAASPSSGGPGGESGRQRRRRRRRRGEKDDEEDEEGGGGQGGGGERPLSAGAAPSPFPPPQEDPEPAEPPPHRVAWAKGLARRLRGESPAWAAPALRSPALASPQPLLLPPERQKSPWRRRRRLA